MNGLCVRPAAHILVLVVVSICVAAVACRGEEEETPLRTPVATATATAVARTTPVPTPAMATPTPAVWTTPAPTRTTRTPTPASATPVPSRTVEATPTAGTPTATATFPTVETTRAVKRALKLPETRVAVTSDELWIVDTDGTGLRQLVQPIGDIGKVAWSPDGKRLTERGVLGGSPGLSQGIALSPSCTTVVFASKEERTDRCNCTGSCASLWLVNIDGTGLRQLTEPMCSLQRFVWSQDGQELFFTGYWGVCPT